MLLSFSFFSLLFPLLRTFFFFFFFFLFIDCVNKVERKRDEVREGVKEMQSVEEMARAGDSERKVWNIIT